MRADRTSEKTYLYRGRAAVFVMAALLCGALLLSLRYGSSGLSWEAFWQALLCREGYETERIILYVLRMPRLLEGILAGVGLSVSGVFVAKRNGEQPGKPQYDRGEFRRGLYGDFDAQPFPFRVFLRCRLPPFWARF